MLFTKEYEIKYYEQNVNGDLKESALLNFLQDIATLSAESLEFGPSFVFANNYAWVVLKYHIELFAPLRNLSSIVIKTEPRGIAKLYAYRDFELYTKDGQCIGKAVSTWVLIDICTRKLLNTQKILADFMAPYQKRETDLVYEKIDSPDELMYQEVFDVRFDDIDVNRHANNSNYIVWALETLPVDFRLKHSPKTIDIKYKKEIGLNARVLSEAQQILTDGNVQTLHVIKDEQNAQDLTSLKIVWQ